MHCLKVRDLEEIVTPQVFEEIHDGKKKGGAAEGMCFSCWYVPFYLCSLRRNLFFFWTYFLKMIQVK